MIEVGSTCYLRCPSCGYEQYDGLFAFRVDGPSFLLLGLHFDCARCDTRSTVPDGLYAAVEGRVRMVSEQAAARTSELSARPARA
jgi:hypothetical protein